MLELFATVDAILVPATPRNAPAIGQKRFVLDGRELPVRSASRHLYAADLVHRLPVVVVPLPLEPLPIGVQIIAARWREDMPCESPARSIKWT